MNILIGGANGGIAQALGTTLAARGHQLSSISRGLAPTWSSHHLQNGCDSASSITAIRDFITTDHLAPELVIQCAGILHNQNNMPEKALARLSESWLMESMRTNLCTHMYLAQAVDSLVVKHSPLKWVSLSAMVGSIGDNQIGGWHSYRMSKAALNMLVRNLSIEWSRRAKGSIAVALHPGTTDTDLSKPFQSNIDSHKLYSANKTGARLSDVIENLKPQQNGQLLHWDGSILPF